MYLNLTFIYLTVDKYYVQEFTFKNHYITLSVSYKLAVRFELFAQMLIIAKRVNEQATYQNIPLDIDNNLIYY